MNTHLLHAEKHDKFLAQARIDPITGDTLEAGDKIVICAECKSAFHSDSWDYLGRRHCNQTRTLPAIPQATSLGHFKKRSAEYYSRVNSNFKIHENVARVVSAGHRLGGLLIDLAMIWIIQYMLPFSLAPLLWTYFLLRDFKYKGRSLSLGKNLMNFEVVEQRDENDLAWWQSVLRNAPIGIPKLAGVFGSYAYHLSYSFGSSFRVADNLLTSIFTIILIIDIILLFGNNKRIMDRAMDLQSVFRTREIPNN
ncbi:RDD family protein [Bernardetia sp.]|uniref:RDD family protein n=1 Tax=Bernardetia sp. TaxID=1937974 RepID=UPI0025C153C1|nr:RDD family protein [Bernardetia sp.]